jgi:hypothetical protein
VGEKHPLAALVQAGRPDIDQLGAEQRQGAAVRQDEVEAQGGFAVPPPPLCDALEDGEAAADAARSGATHDVRDPVHLRGLQAEALHGAAITNETRSTRSTGIARVRGV